MRSTDSGAAAPEPLKGSTLNWRGFLVQHKRKVIYALDLQGAAIQTVQPKRPVTVRALQRGDWRLLRRDILARSDWRGYWWARCHFGRRGSSIFAAEADGRLVHISWAHQGPAVLGAMPVAEGEVFIGPCYTVPEARGQGLYPYVVGCILQEYRRRQFARAIMTVGGDNAASIRGIEKVGFQRIGFLEYTRVVGVIKVRRRVRLAGEEDGPRS